MNEAVRRHEPVSVSAITLLEIAILADKGTVRLNVPLGQLLHSLESSPVLQIVPFTIDIAAEVAAIGDSLRDPSDRAIVGTARVRGLKLLTSDGRIIDSNLVPVIV
jgi:PIN domain nuclease of toxin-antitoxin system